MTSSGKVASIPAVRAIRTLAAGSVYLREFRKSDWRAVHRYASDPETVKIQNWGPNTIEQTQEFLGRVIDDRKERPRRRYELAALRKVDDVLVGGGALRIKNANQLEGEIGYIVSREMWGRGYATAIAGALLRFGFAELKLHRISAICHIANKASARVLAKAGFRKEGCMREYMHFKGAWHDFYSFAILDREWRESRRRKRA